MNLAAIGVNFKSAPVAVREAISLGKEKLRGALAALHGAFPGHECVIVSTCNRTEVYLAGESEIPRVSDVLSVLGVEATLAEEVGGQAYVKQGREAVRHLMAVAASLDAMVVGETEVLGQVKQAYLSACQNDTVGRVLHTVFQGAISTAKRVHAETEISRGRVSVSTIAVDFSERVFDELTDKTVLIVGAGETAEIALQTLVDRGVHDVVVANRSLENGQALASRFNGKAIPFAGLAEHLKHVDLVICSTGAPTTVINVDAAQQASLARRGKPMLYIDIAVPRDVDAAVGQLANVYLYDIDDLQRIADENRKQRESAAEAAWELVLTAAEELNWFGESADLREVLAQLDRRARAIKEEAVSKALAREKLAGLPDEAKAEIEKMFDKAIRKLLAQPRDALKAASRNGRWEAYARVAKDLFDTPDQQQAKPAKRESQD